VSVNQQEQDRCKVMLSDGWPCANLNPCRTHSGRSRPAAAQDSTFEYAKVYVGKEKASITPAVAAVKHDVDKPRMSLIPPEAEEAIARVLTHGAKKYSPENWRDGFDWSRLYDAARRHMNAFWRGQDTDTETGESHIAHALCCLMFLQVHWSSGLGSDDRPQVQSKSDSRVDRTL
jgi:hypothetical protein